MSNHLVKQSPSVVLPLYADTSTKRNVNVLDLHAVQGAEFKAWFAPAFGRFLRENFANPEQVAASFDVRMSTACNWWNGDNKASGDAITRAFMAFPHAVAWFQQEWAQR